MRQKHIVLRFTTLKEKKRGAFCKETWLFLFKKKNNNNN